MRFPRTCLRGRSIRNEFRAIWDMLDLSAQAGRLGLIGRAIRGAKKARHVMRGRHGALNEQSESEPDDDVRESSLNDPLLSPAQCCASEAWVVTHSNLQANVSARRRNYLHLKRALDASPFAAPSSDRIARGPCAICSAIDHQGRRRGVPTHARRIAAGVPMGPNLARVTVAGRRRRADLVVEPDTGGLPSESYAVGHRLHRRLTTSGAIPRRYFASLADAPAARRRRTPSSR